MTKEQVIKCMKISRHYGFGKQKMQTLQEMAELAVLLTQRPEQISAIGDYTGRITEEIADCMIMLQQIDATVNVDRSSLRNAIDRKLDRQLQRIADAKSTRNE